MKIENRTRADCAGGWWLVGRNQKIVYVRCWGLIWKSGVINISIVNSSKEISVKVKYKCHV